MKLYKRISILAALSVTFSLGIGLLVNLNASHKEVDAYTIASLPTTIDLNDCSESDIRDYYSDLNSMDVSERKGTNLLKNLKTILSNGQKYYSYDSNTKIWQMYEITDRDWVKSPASSTTYGTYDSVNNKLVNYVYGSSKTDVKNNPYVHALYINRNIDNKTKAWGNHDQDGWGINQEHIWAKSHGFDTKGSNSSGGARGDPMHLWAGNGWANHEHSNYFFAFVDKTRTYSDAGTKYGTAYNNLTGYSKSAGGSETVFEPQDSDKGDIARAIFYMAARYNNYVNETSGIDGNNPNLRLLNDLSENSRTGTSSYNNPYGMGLLRDLLAWNKLDPVDEYEIHRNNLLYKNYTNNRNPFIDFPNWADVIWGTTDIDGTNYSSTTVGYATPSTDHIGPDAGSFDITVKELELPVGNTAEISTRNATGTTTWTVADDTVVSLDKTSTTGNGKVTITALKNGTTTITATNGSDSVTCTVTVADAINYGSLNEPLTIAEAKQIIDNNNGQLTNEKMYVKGIVTSNSSFSDQYGNYSQVWLKDQQNENTFELYHCAIDIDDASSYTLENSMVDSEVVAYGYAKKYNSTYELSPLDNNTDYPVILSLRPAGGSEETPQEQVEALTTTSTLAYHYDKQVEGEVITDTLTKALIGVSSNSYTAWSNKTDASDAVYAGKSIGASTAIQLNSNDKKPGIVTTASAGIVSKVTITWDNGTAENRILDIYGKHTAYSSADDLYGNTPGTVIGSATCDSNHTTSVVTLTDEYEYIGIKSRASAIYITSIQIQWGEETITYNYSNVSLRFGGLLTQELWNDLDTNSENIEGFGVMIATAEFLNGQHIKDVYDSAAVVEDDPDIEEEIVDYFMAREEMATPVAQNNNYVWNLFYRITNLTKVYTGAAYIRTTGGYVFFREVSYSAKTLAADYIANRGYSASIASGSLSNLANL